MKYIKRFDKVLLLAFIGASTLSCATAYQEKSFFGYGYSEVDAGDDKKRLYFNGNFATNANVIQDYVHKRASAYCKTKNSNGYELLDEIIVGREKTQKDRDFVKSKHLSPPTVTIVIRCFGEDEDEEG